jgi:flavodoxin I
LKKMGVTLVGSVSKEGYSFTGSMAVVKGKFVGLAIDEEFESHLTAQRVKNWVQQLKMEFSI